MDTHAALQTHPYEFYSTPGLASAAASVGGTLYPTLGIRANTQHNQPVHATGLANSLPTASGSTVHYAPRLENAGEYAPLSMEATATASVATSTTTTTVMDSSASLTERSISMATPSTGLNPLPLNLNMPGVSAGVDTHHHLHVDLALSSGVGAVDPLGTSSGSPLIQSLPAPITADTEPSAALPPAVAQGHALLPLTTTAATTATTMTGTTATAATEHVPGHQDAVHHISAMHMQVVVPSTSLVGSSHDLSHDGLSLNSASYSPSHVVPPHVVVPSATEAGVQQVFIGQPYLAPSSSGPGVASASTSVSTAGISAALKQNAPRKRGRPRKRKNIAKMLREKANEATRLGGELNPSLVASGHTLPVSGSGQLYMAPGVMGIPQAASFPPAGGFSSTTHLETAVPVYSTTASMISQTSFTGLNLEIPSRNVIEIMRMDQGPTDLSSMNVPVGLAPSLPGMPAQHVSLAQQGSALTSTATVSTSSITEQAPNSAFSGTRVSASQIAGEHGNASDDSTPASGSRPSKTGALGATHSSKRTTPTAPQSVVTSKNSRYSTRLQVTQRAAQGEDASSADATGSGSDSASSSFQAFASQSQLESLVFRTKRVKVACVPCRQQKMACESARPCSRCVRHGREDKCIDFVPGMTPAAANAAMQEAAAAAQAAREKKLSETSDETAKSDVNPDSPSREPSSASIAGTGESQAASATDVQDTVTAASNDPTPHLEEKMDNPGDATASAAPPATTAGDADGSNSTEASAQSSTNTSAVEEEHESNLKYQERVMALSSPGTPGTRDDAAVDVQRLSWQKVVAANRPVPVVSGPQSVPASAVPPVPVSVPTSVSSVTATVAPSTVPPSAGSVSTSLAATEEATSTMMPAAAPSLPNFSTSSSNIAISPPATSTTLDSVIAPPITSASIPNVFASIPASTPIMTTSNYIPTSRSQPLSLPSSTLASNSAPMAPSGTAVTTSMGLSQVSAVPMPPPPIPQGLSMNPTVQHLALPTSQQQQPTIPTAMTSSGMITQPLSLPTPVHKIPTPTPPVAPPAQPALPTSFDMPFEASFSSTPKPNGMTTSSPQPTPQPTPQVNSTGNASEPVPSPKISTAHLGSKRSREEMYIASGLYRQDLSTIPSATIPSADKPKKTLRFSNLTVDAKRLSEQENNSRKMFPETPAQLASTSK